MVMLLVIVLFSIGLASVFIQCKKLASAVSREREKYKQQQKKLQIATPAELKKRSTNLRNEQGQTKEELKKELRDMNIVRKEVKAKLQGLETMVENAKRNQQTVENKTRLKTQ